MQSVSVFLDVKKLLIFGEKLLMSRETSEEVRQMIYMFLGFSLDKV